MFSLRSLSTVAAVAAFASVPAAALAVQTNSPIAVTSCSAETQAPALTTGFVPVFATPFSNVNLSFVNNASVPATNVELLVTVDGATSRIDTRRNVLAGHPHRPLDVGDPRLPERERRDVQHREGGLQGWHQLERARRAAPHDRFPLSHTR